MDILSVIEDKLGRIRTQDKYTDRTIDLDILIFDNLILNDKNLIIPHPEIKNRIFALEPLGELIPDFILPTTDKSILFLLENARKENLSNTNSK